MVDILAEIVARKRDEVALAKRNSLPLREGPDQGSSPRGFSAALDNAGEVRLIAEIKRASPSAGIIREPFDPRELAQAYERGGAACLSVLTNEHYFQGNLADLTAARDACRLPVLRKEFIIDEFQLIEARAAGADAVLLIAEVLPGEQLHDLTQAANALNLDVLIELHDREQLDRVLACETKLVGINNRDLRRFVTRLEHTLEIVPDIPSDRIIVSESGIRTADDVRRLRDAGVKAMLVGESLLRQADVAAAVGALLASHGSAL